MNGEPGVWRVFARACAAVALVCALTFAFNAALPGAQPGEAQSGPCYTYAFTAEDSEDAGLLVKKRSGQRVLLSGDGGETELGSEPVRLQPGITYTLTADTEQAPAVYLGAYSVMCRLWSATGSVNVAVASAYAVMLLYTLSLYMDKRSERYLLSFAGYLVVMLTWTAAITVSRQTAPAAFVQQVGFTLLSFIAVRLCASLTKPRLPRALAWVRSCWLYAVALAAMAVDLLGLVLLRNVINLALMTVGVYILSCAVAQGRRHARVLLAAMVLLMGLRPCVMFFSVDALFMRESLSFYIVRTRTRAHDIILVLAAMLFVNREFAWQFAEKERLAAHLDELVRERTQKLMDMQAQRQSVMLNIFHDIRTPLTVMRGALDVIEASPEAVGTMVPLISSRLRFVTELTGDLFLVAKLEDGQVMLTCARVDLSAVAREQGEQTAQLAREAGVTLETEIEPGLVIWGERLRLSQIAQNLLTNAVHYTPRGGLVRLTLAREGGEAVLRVSDTGKGIAPEDQKHIFDRYFHTTAQTKHESSGLGLTIARELTLLHRGTLSVESELERGTTFIVRFALLDAADEPA